MPVRRPPRSAPSTAPKAPKKDSEATSKKTTTKPIAKRIKTDSYVFPAASSAPQPSVSSNQPQVRKPSRGRPLKVKKGVTMPQGYGVLSCPFTNRVFDVWGARAHDISNTSSKQPRRK